MIELLMLEDWYRVGELDITGTKDIQHRTRKQPWTSAEHFAMLTFLQPEAKSSGTSCASGSVHISI